MLGSARWASSWVTKCLAWHVIARIGIAFGRPYLSNPDLVERCRNGWPLADLPDMSTWYSPAGGEGYTDFPAYQAG